jgi:hypothetical protein
LPVSASLQLKPDCDVSALERSACVRPAGKKAERASLDRGRRQEAREAWQELRAWSDERPHHDDNDDEYQ